MSSVTVLKSEKTKLCQKYKLFDTNTCLCLGH